MIAKVKQHPFQPGVVVVRRVGNLIRRTATCQVCEKPGREVTTVRTGRQVTYWQHGSRPPEEPAPLEACDWQGTGGMWCCRKLGHALSHHIHRGPRRNVAH